MQKLMLPWQKLVTMHTVTPVIGSNAPLGPVLTTQVELKGSPVTALIDTGSQVTIISLKFLIEALEKYGLPEQSANWRADVEKRMKPTTHCDTRDWK